MVNVDEGCELLVESRVILFMPEVIIEGDEVVVGVTEVSLTTVLPIVTVFVLGIPILTLLLLVMTLVIIEVTTPIDMESVGELVVCMKVDDGQSSTAIRIRHTTTLLNNKTAYQSQLSQEECLFLM